ncbi:MAG: ABC transporter ATP-binding protein [Bacillota bacterium]|nr:ABC transporter ATP-binding protein [Bacillota bacterium]
MQPVETRSGQKLVFTYHKKSSEFKSFVFGLILLIGLFEMPVLVLLLAYVVKSAAGKGVTIFFLGLGIYAVGYVLPSLLLTRHVIAGGVTGSSLIIHFGTKFKGIIPLSNIAGVKQAGRIRSKGLGLGFDASYIPEESLLRVTTGDKNLILIELMEPQKFKFSLGRPFFAQKVLINVDEPEKFVAALGQRLVCNFQKTERFSDEEVKGFFERVPAGRRDTTSGVALEVQGLEKYYGSFKAVDGIDLSVKAGEIFGFLGPNGAGKTTTMNMAAGILWPSGGTVRIFGTDIWKDPLPAKKHLGYVPENPLVYERLTGREFLKFTAELYGMGRKGGLEEKISNLLLAFDLIDAADALIGTYSQGMRRKIALAAALVHDPKLLILDEPTNGLDPKGAWFVKHLLRKLSEQGAAVFMSTHVLEVAENMCDRVAIIYKGRIVAEGTVDELKQQAKRPESNLEELFLTLTESGDSRNRVIANW